MYFYKLLSLNDIDNLGALELNTKLSCKLPILDLISKAPLWFGSPAK
jgi:hypothetical protein